MDYFHEIIKVPSEFLAWIYLISENHVTSVAKHWHRSLEITYILEGDALYDINGYQFIASSGDLILINSGDIHACQMNYTQKTEAVSVIIPFPFLKEVFHNIEDIRFLTDPNKPGYQTLVHAFIDIYPVFKERKSNTFYQLKVNSFFYEILYLLFSDFQTSKTVPSAIKTQKYMDRCTQIMDYIDKHYRETITLDTLASDYGISKEHLARTFKECMGTTFKKYLTSIRMHHAYQALIDSDYSILQIALDNGFSDARAFTSAFCKFYGETPQKYRKALQNTQTSHVKYSYLRTRGSL